MALLTRLTRLLRADLHAVMDRLEEPDLLLAQAVRDMEAALADDQGLLAGLREEQTRLRARRDDLTRTLAGLADELAVCLAADADELARALLRRRLETERAARSLDQTETALRERAEALAVRMQTRERQLAETRARAGHALAGPAPARWEDSAFAVTDTDVEVALLAEKQRRGAP